MSEGQYKGDYMSLRNNPDRKGKNHRGMDERLESNQQKSCKVKSCDANRYGFTGYCNIHGSRYADYGDPKQVPTRLSGDFLSYYKAVLRYIESHEDELREHLSTAERLIKYPDLMKFHDISEMERWFPPIDYRDKGRPIGDKAMRTLYRWKRDIRIPKHYLASVIAPHLMHYQEPEYLLGGRPVHMMITRSLMKQCRTESHTEFLPYDPYEKKIRWKTVVHTNRVGTRDRANVGFRLTAMFSKAIAMVVPNVPTVIDEGAKEHREKLEYYKQIEKMYKDGDKRITEGTLVELRRKLGV